MGGRGKFLEKKEEEKDERRSRSYFDSADRMRFVKDDTHDNMKRNYRIEDAGKAKAQYADLISKIGFDFTKKL